MNHLQKCRFSFTQSGLEPEIIHSKELPGSTRAARLQTTLWVSAHCFASLTQLIQMVLRIELVKVKVLVTQSCPTLCDSMDYNLSYQAPHPWNFPGKSTGAGCHFLLQGIFLTQGFNPGLPLCRQILYHLSHQGSPWLRIIDAQQMLSIKQMWGISS